MVGTPPSSPSAVTGSSPNDLLTDKEAAAAAATEATRLAKERQDTHDAAMVRAANADANAAAAAKALDAARALAAQERAAAAAALAPLGSFGSGPHAAMDLHTAMLLQEAAALLNLHAQAVAIHNIRSLVPIVLDILGTLADDLAEAISSQGSTARNAWLAVESQFLGNREAHAIQLETRFRNFVQGDLSISEYCHCLKKMADDLGALDEVITDRTLILYVIRGLNDNSAHVGALLQRGRPFPSFLETRDDLILEELTLANRQSSPAAALATSTRTSAPSPQTGSGSGGANAGSGSGGANTGGRSNNNCRGKRGSNGRGGGGGSGGGGGGQHATTGPQQQQAGGTQPTPGAQTAAPQGAPWPSFYNP
ncbi:keratin, type I cytoskeletal 9-like [Panicum virgatum]|uniref:keratin, type I cytoskeletal 9-like n=1 Tax=Panicum virgatum TaxID=38727 RepID=UPI0019D60D9C|nr:keratin, type I cytoskeletal 9-like [Panicum virgatum]